MDIYRKVYDAAATDRDRFWSGAASQLHWHKPWEQVLRDDDAPFYKWFAGGQCNICYNALDRHAKERGGQLALVYDSPVTGSRCEFTYDQLLDQVSRFASGLQQLGVEQGDRVLIYMPNMPEAIIGMLATARLGAIHSVVFGGFAPKELAHRIEDAQPKVILTASCGIEPGRIIEYKPLVDRAIELAGHSPRHTVVRQRHQAPADLSMPRDLDWADIAGTETRADCVFVESNEPLYILYTSGTTGVPKGVVHDQGGTMVALDWSMRNIYGVASGDVYWAASDIGWVVGHSYMVYGPLLAGCTTVIYEGKPVGTPDATAFWRVMSENKVNVFFTAPTAFRAIKKEDPGADLVNRFDLSALRRIFLAGERADPDTIHWAEDALELPVIDHWWQTETGWPVAANPVGIELLPVKYGSASVPVPGYDIRVLDEGRNEMPAGQTGAIVIKLPLPPGTLPTLWQNDEHFVHTYLETFPGYYETKDAGYIDEDGYVFVMARTDDIINVAGHRLSTGGIEELISEHPDVAECAVIGVNCGMKGQLPVGLLVLNSGVSRPPDEIIDETILHVREKLGAVAAFKQAAVVDRLPKTRSGKVLRGTMRKIADSEPWKMPATIDDPAILDEIAAALKSLGYAGNDAKVDDSDLD